MIYLERDRTVIIDAAAKIVPRLNKERLSYFKDRDQMRLAHGEDAILSLVDDARDLETIAVSLGIPVETLCARMARLINRKFVIFEDPDELRLVTKTSEGAASEAGSPDIQSSVRETTAVSPLPDNKSEPPVLPETGTELEGAPNFTEKIDDDPAGSVLPADGERNEPDIELETSGVPQGDMDEVRSEEAVPSAERPRTAAVESEQGDWDIDGLVDLFTKIHGQKITARLRLYYGKDTYRSLYFDVGELIGILSKPFDPNECLGRLFQKAGVIKQEDVVASLLRKKQTGWLQGETLVAMGKIKPERLKEALRAQVGIKLAPVFDWLEGTYELLRLTEPPDWLPRQEVELPRMLFGLLWKHYPDFMIDPGLRKHEDQWVGKAENLIFDPLQFGLGQQLWKFWETILEKDIPLKRVLITSHLKPDQAKRFVWLMSRMCMIVYLDDTREDKMLGRVKDLAEWLKFIEKKNYFDLLGVHWTAKEAQITRIYEKLKAEYGARLESAVEPERSLLEKAWWHLQNAYDAIKDHESRQKYRRKIYDPSFIEINAELFREKGESYLFTKEDFSQAVEEIESSIEVLDPNGETLAVLGLSTFLKGHQGQRPLIEKGRSILVRGYNMVPSSEIVNLCMGMMYRREKQFPKALQFYRRVLEINPKHKFAKIEIREIETGERAAEREKVIREFLENRKKPVPETGRAETAPAKPVRK